MAELNRKISDQMLGVGAGRPFLDLKGEFELTPSEVIYTKDRVKLLHYKPLKKSVLPVPLLVVYALINRYYILDLQPDRSVVRRYLERGIDVYVIDWGSPDPSDRYETIGDEVDYIDTMVDVIRERSKVDKINLQGFCMGGTFSVIYASLHPEKVRSLVAQDAPVDFSKDDGILNKWIRHIDPDKIVDTFGNIPASFMNIGFLLMNPIGNLLDKYVTFYENIGDRDSAETFLRMEKWIFDSPDQPGESYRQLLKDLYQKNLLVKKELVVNDMKVDLKRIDMPLLLVTAEQDNIVPPSSSTPLNALVSSRVKKQMSFPGRHIGLCISAKAHEEFWPEVADWIAKNSERKKEKRS